MQSTTSYVSPWFQCLIFAISLAILGISIQKPIERFTSLDRTPELHTYAPATEPAHSVQVGIHIRNFTQTDLIKNEFTCNGTIWFTFDPQVIKLEDISKFTIDSGELLERSEPQITTVGNRTIATYTIRAKFKTDLNFAGYPLDDHMLYLVVSNQFIDASRIGFVFDQRDFTYSKDVHIPNMTIQQVSTQAGYTEHTMHHNGTETTVRHPRIIGGIACNRIDIRHFVNMFLPLLLIFFMTTFAFSFDFAEHGSTVPSIAIAGVPALLAYRFVIEAASPDVDYFMLSDYLFFLFLLLALAIFFAISVALHASERHKKMIIVSLYAFMTIACISLFYIFL